VALRAIAPQGLVASFKLGNSDRWQWRLPEAEPEAPKNEQKTWALGKNMVPSPKNVGFFEGIMVPSPKMRVFDVAWSSRTLRDTQVRGGVAEFLELV
jgi:hypothetical protein